MEIKLSKNIVDHVKEKGLAGIEIDTRISGCCCGSFENINTRFISESRVKTLLSYGYREYDADGIKVMIAGHISTEDLLDIRMVKILGLKSIKVGGIKLSCNACRTAAGRVSELR